MKLCLLKPPAEAAQAASLLDAAADAVLQGRTAQAADLLRQADFRVLHAYAAYVMSEPVDLIGITKGTHRREHARFDARLAVRMPTGKEAEEIYRRDGYRCRYCNGRVFRPGVRAHLTSLFPDIVQWPSGKGGDRSKHAAFYALNGVLDHIQPHAHGGANSADNIVTSCWPCNYGKKDRTLEQLGLADPRLRDPVVDGWDGLGRLMKRVPKRPRLLPNSKVVFVSLPPQSLAVWLTRISPEPSGAKREALIELLTSLEQIRGVHLSFSQNLIVNVQRQSRLLSVLGISAEGDVDVPWLIDGEKDWFKPFAQSLSEAVPGAKLYETPKMWRVDGGGRRKGQINLDEFIYSASVIRHGIQRLTEQ